MFVWVFCCFCFFFFEGNYTFGVKSLRSTNREPGAMCRWVGWVWGGGEVWGCKRVFSLPARFLCTRQPVPSMVGDMDHLSQHVPNSPGSSGAKEIRFWKVLCAPWTEDERQATWMLPMYC